MRSFQQNRSSVALCFMGLFLFSGCRSIATAPSLEVAQVWSGHPVGFCLLTHDRRQYVAYYDEQRRMTVAVRELESNEWDYQILPETVGWDSHNSIVMAIDNEGLVHLSGNMHCDPLIYFRTKRPYDIHTFERIPHMVGILEDRVTYPHFFRGPAGEFIFTCRHGGSGRGDQIYNVYDLKTRTWSRLLDSPLTDGRGQMNAYINGPVPGPDGCFHFVWVWRDTPNCYTNHDLSYVRTRDMLNWETAEGKPLRLPITIDTPGIIVDPVPIKGGMINGNAAIGFDSQNRLILSYHKFDDNGNTQIYNARLENDQWKFYQATDWNHRWFFEGGGAIHFEIRVSPVVFANGSLTQRYHHDTYGSGTWTLDEEMLKPLGYAKHTRLWPEELDKPQSPVPHMQVNWRGDSGKSPSPNVKYFLRWETLYPNRDKPRDTAPAPTTLRLYKFNL